MSNKKNLQKEIIEEVKKIKLSQDSYTIENMKASAFILLEYDTMLPHVLSYATILYKKKYDSNYLNIAYKRDDDSLCYILIEEIEKNCKECNSFNIDESFKKCLKESVENIFQKNDKISKFVLNSRKKFINFKKGKILKEEEVNEVTLKIMKELEIKKEIKKEIKDIESKNIEDLDDLDDLDDLEDLEDLDDLEFELEENASKIDEVKSLEVLEEVINIKPKDIYTELKEYISGNKETLKMLSSVVCLHNNSITDDFEHKLNPLIIGDSGCGKTYSIDRLSKITKLPYLNISAKGITETGWSGGNIEDVLVNFFKKNINDENIEIINDEIYLKSIIFIDEIDKIKQNFNYNNIDIGGEGVQNVLLSYIENGSIPHEKDMYLKNKKYSTINTSKCLFIFAGAFNGIEDVVSKRLKLKGKKDINSIYKNINVNDLIEYGFKKEFAARLSVISTMPPLSKANLIDILKNKKNSIADYYKRVMELQGIKIDYTDCFYEEVVNMVMETKINARGFKSIFYKLFANLIYDGDSAANINLDKEFVRLTLSDNNHLKII
jgi:ATP-dependent Clp protease ATP-binding subunit ClpX